jgi:hypothetical protein
MGKFEEGFSCLPQSFLTAARNLEQARMVLGRHYVEAERGENIDTTAFGEIHRELIQYFSAAKDGSSDVKLQSLVSMLNDAKELKRRADEDLGRNPKKPKEG